MSEAERAFYEWWHKNGKPDFIEDQRAAFVAGWVAAEKQITEDELKGTSANV